MSDSSGPLRRVRFFHGQLLTAGDLLEDQDYFRRRLQLHNRFLHGWGVVEGLTIILDSGTLRVEAGFALDCAGNEILVVATAKCLMPKSGEVVYVVIRYTEKETAPVRLLETDHDEAGICYSRVEERWEIQFLSHDPSCDSDDSLHPSGTCGKPHGIALGRFHRHGEIWQKDQGFMVKHLK